MAGPDYELWNSILQDTQSGIADLKADMAVVKENTIRTDIRLKIVESHMTGFMSSARYLENESTPCAAGSKPSKSASALITETELAAEQEPGAWIMRIAGAIRAVSYIS